MSEVTLRFRSSIPQDFRSSLDTRIYWLWNQRFGTVQEIIRNNEDVLDVTAAWVVLQAIWAKDLEAIALVFRRLEGGAQEDTEVQELAGTRV